MLPIDPLLTVRPLGVRVTVNLSTIIVVGLMSGGATAGLDPGPNDPARWTLGAMAAVLMFALVVGLHVSSQILAFRRLGSRVRHVHVLSFGGIVLPGRQDDSPRREVLLGGVGLLLVLIPASATVYGVVAGGGTLPRDDWFSAAVVTSGCLATIQLLPGLGLSGGRVIRSLVWYLTDNALTGARVAAAYGYVIGTGLMGLGLGIIGLGGARPYWGFWAIVAGWQLSGTARVEVYRTRWRSLATTRTLMEILQPASRVSATATIDQAIDLLLASGSEHPLLVISDDGVPVGILRLDNLRGLRRSEWHRQPVSVVTTPIAPIPHISADAMVIDAMDLLDLHDASLLVVTSGGGPNHPIAVLTRGTLLGRLHERPPTQRLRQG